MITRIILIVALALGLFGSVHAQKKETGSTTASQSAVQKAEWKCVSRTCSKDIQDPDIGPLHIRVWRGNKNQIVFTVMTPCAANSSLSQTVSWTKGDSWGRGTSCDKRHLSVHLSKDAEKKFDPLPVQMKSETLETPDEKLT